MARPLYKKILLMSIALAVAVTGATASLVGTQAVSAEEACTVSEKLVNSCRPWLGAAAGGYPNVSGTGGQMLAHESRIGRQVDVAHLYTTPGSHVLSDESVFFANRADTILSVTWQPASQWADASGANALTNANIDRMADSIKALGDRKIMLTLHHEPENDVSGGALGCAANKTFVGSAGTPAEYRAMWQTVRDRFDAKGVSNVVWVMNYMGYSGWDCIVDDLWPGNHLVDWVQYDPYGEKVDFPTLIGRFYNFLEQTSNVEHDYLSKPWGLAEYGSWHNATQEHAYLLYQTAKTAVENNQFPRLKLYSVFDYGATCRIAYDRDGNYDPVELEYYRQFANSPVFSGQVTVPDPDPEPVPDTQAPSTPANLTATAGLRSAMLSWDAATDNVGVAGYYVVRDGVRIATLDASARSFTDTGLTSGKTYWYKVRAFDAAGNRGEQVTVAVRAQ